MNLFEIDMKNTTLYIRDGKAVQLSAGQETSGITAAGATSITFAAGGVAAAGLSVGMWLAADSSLRPRYFITAIDGDDVTIHRGLEAAIPDATLIHKSDWNQLEIDIGEGNLTWSLKLPREYKLSKGKLSHAKNADEEPMDVSVDAIWDFISSNVGGGVPTVYEALLRTGEAATWVSAGGECQPYSVDLVLLNEPDCATLTNPNEIIVYPDFRPDNLDGDLDGGTLSLPGKCMSLTPITARYT